MNYLPETLILQFDITMSMKSYVKRVLGHIKCMHTCLVEDEELPPIRVAKQKCMGGCGNKQTCKP